MTLDEARRAVIPFDRFAGNEIGEVAETEFGRCHLAWLAEWFTKLPLLYPGFQVALRTYLSGERRSSAVASVERREN